MKKGFTLIELLITLAIIGILTAVLLSSVETQKDEKDRSELSNEQIIRQSKNCTDHGLKAVPETNFNEDKIYSIKCWPKE